MSIPPDEDDSTTGADSGTTTAEENLDEQDPAAEEGEEEIVPKDEEEDHEEEEGEEDPTAEDDDDEENDDDDDEDEDDDDDDEDEDDEDEDDDEEVDIKDIRAIQADLAELKKLLAGGGRCLSKAEAQVLLKALRDDLTDEDHDDEFWTRMQALLAGRPLPDADDDEDEVVPRRAYRALAKGLHRVVANAVEPVRFRLGEFTLRR